MNPISIKQEEYFRTQTTRKRMSYFLMGYKAKPKVNPMYLRECVEMKMNVAPTENKLQN